MESRSGGSAISRSRSWIARSATRPLRVFPYRAELDQSGALLRALGAGVPAVVYDVGGLGEPVREYGAGRVVAAGDVDALAARRGRAARRPDCAGRGARGRRAGARRADLGRLRSRAPRALPGARLSRFGDLIDRQLGLFCEDYADLIDGCDAAERAYDRAGREEAEERYAEYLDLVEEGAEALAEIRDTYASTLDPRWREEYEQAFEAAVRRRSPRGSPLGL